MAKFSRNRALSPIQQAVIASLFVASGAHAQQDVSLKPVLITERRVPALADVTGFGDVPLKDLPLSATVVGQADLLAVGARRLADIAQFDASINDAYNSPGYWDFLTVRGFVIDNRFNYRREGLPISAETSIPLENKERIEVLKGTSGIQAGTSAPGGLVNYVVKRPTSQPLRDVRLEVTGKGSVLVTADLGGRAGTDQAFGYRLNVAHENLKPLTRNLNGQRSLLALATDWRLNRDATLSAEVEWSRKSQPSQAGFSLLGNVLPAPVDPKLNLNNQPWSQPSEFDALTGTVRFDQAINADWRWSAQVGQQKLKTNDRLAYAYGCSTEGMWDRYCSDGTFDMYDFRSENERRTQQAASLNVNGKVNTGSVVHSLGLGLQSSRVKQRFQMQAYNWVGIGNVQGTTVVPADPTLSDQSTNRDEHSIELSLQDSMRWSDRLTSWIGLRHSRISRDSIRTNGSRPTAYDDSITTPWLAVSYAISPAEMLYASVGQGVESQVVPNKSSQYSNAGVALPALKSRQWELGVKGGRNGLGWQVAVFNIVRPMTNLDACYRLGTTPCKGQYDGEAAHRGVETSLQWEQGPWRLGGSATILDAKRQGSLNEPATNGKEPTNVPNWVLRANANWRVNAVPGLSVHGQLSHEGQRAILADSNLTLPAWSRVDASLRYETKLVGTPTTWTLGAENLFDKRYWKESPYQYGHVYLFPGAARTWRLAMQASF
ncbi:TonB-dependent siderophore receptor [Rhodoferax sp.]|uniref:TonB-dependent siderophore receptor n=1 Tax=Rhodoferax sp. TaxID=50421 RepID=UPI00274B9D9F|nr:TonB-dependent siderophore receptor [Rhodoferax sp.]